MEKGVGGPCEWAVVGAGERLSGVGLSLSFCPLVQGGCVSCIPGLARGHVDSFIMPSLLDSADGMVDGVCVVMDNLILMLCPSSWQ